MVHVPANRPHSHRAPPAGRRGRRGAALVEFAFVAPIFFALVIGGIEFGRAMMSLNLLSNAARNGARVGALPGNSDSNVSDAVTNALSAGAVDATQANVTVQVNGATANCNTATTGDAVSVTVSISASNVSWLASPWFLGNTSLSQTAVMRHE